jgi:PAS domain S-box-containing protein
MIGINDQDVVEVVNPAASALFGLTTEQLLGHPLSFLFAPDNHDNALIFETLQMMLAGLAPLHHESDGVATKGDGSLLRLSVFVRGFAAADRVVRGFGLICRDRAQELKEEEELSAARQATYDLTRALIPTFLAPLSGGNPTFMARGATVAVCSLGDFVQYATAIPPEQLLSNVTSIFGEFAKILSETTGMVHIALFGDLYFVACGLFAAENDPVPAQTAVQFALKCIERVEDMNAKQNTGYQLQVGMHSGGTVYVGVDESKQAYQVVGSSLSIARKLNSRALPGTVNISGETYKSVSAQEYQVDPHEPLAVGTLGLFETYSLSAVHRVVGIGSRTSLTRLSASPSATRFEMPSLNTLIGNDGEPPMYDPPGLDLPIGGHTTDA